MKLRTSLSVLTLAAAGLILSCNKEDASLNSQPTLGGAVNSRVNLSSVSQIPGYVEIEVVMGGGNNNIPYTPNPGDNNPHSTGCIGFGICGRAGLNLTLVDLNQVYQLNEHSYYMNVSTIQNGDSRHIIVSKDEISPMAASGVFKNGVFTLDSDAAFPASTCAALGVSSLKFKRGVYPVTETNESYSFEIIVE